MNPDLFYRLTILLTVVLALLAIAKGKGVVAVAFRYFFAALLSEDDGNKVPDLVRVIWFAGALLALGGFAEFLILAWHWAMDVPPCVPAPGMACPEHKIDLMLFATAFAAMSAGFAGFMVGCSAALAIKTKSGA